MDSPVSEVMLIDGFGPLPVRRPATVAELCGLVREAAAAGQAIYPVGGGTTLDLGLPPTKAGFAVSILGLAAVEDYPARDMTITAGAGITIAAVQAALAKERQYLPIDVPHPERTTLGGAIAANLSGPRRLGHGTFRDAVIGIRFVTDDGVEVKGGGRVVKNVAGYDLMKLQTGALGTLGIITQVTLKVKPRPESQAFVAFGINTAAIGPTLDRLHASAARPIAIELLNAVAARALSAGGPMLPAHEPWVIICGFEEKATTVAWQVATLLDELKSTPARDAIELRNDALWAALAQLKDRGEEYVRLRAAVVPSATSQVATAAAAAHPDAIVHAHAGNGVIHIHLPVDPTPERLSAIVVELTKRTTEGNGSLIVRRCPPAWKSQLPIWGRDRGDRELMRTVKASLDPNGVFNPGRI